MIWNFTMRFDLGFAHHCSSHEPCKLSQQHHKHGTVLYKVLARVVVVIVVVVAYDRSSSGWKTSTKTFAVSKTKW